MSFIFNRVYFKESSEGSGNPEIAEGTIEDEEAIEEEPGLEEQLGEVTESVNDLAEEVDQLREELDKPAGEELEEEVTAEVDGEEWSREEIHSRLDEISEELEQLRQALNGLEEAQQVESVEDSDEENEVVPRAERLGEEIEKSVENEEEIIGVEDIKEMSSLQIESETPDDPYQLFELMKELKNEIKENDDIEVEANAFGTGGEEAENLRDKVQYELSPSFSEEEHILKTKYKNLSRKLMQQMAAAEELPWPPEKEEKPTTEEAETETEIVEDESLTKEEKVELEEDAHEALKEQREIIDIPPDLLTEVITDQEITQELAPILMEAVKEDNPELAREEGREVILNMFENLTEDQKQKLEGILENHGVEVEEFLEKWKEELAETVVDSYFEEWREEMQEKVEDSIGTWDQIKAGWKELGAKSLGIAGAGFVAGVGAKALGATGATQWISRATGARTFAGLVKDKEVTEGGAEEAEQALEQLRKERREEFAEEVFEDMTAGTPQETNELIAGVISEEIRAATAAEKIKKEIKEASEGDIDIDTKKLRDKLGDTSMRTKKERVLYEYSQELKEQGLEEEAIKKKYEALANQLENNFLQRRDLLEAAVDRGASEQVLENLEAEFEGEIPEDAEQIDPEAVKIMKEVGIPLAAGGAGIVAAAEGLPGAGGAIVGAEAGHRAGKAWEQHAQKEHIAIKEAKKIQKEAVELLQETGDGVRLAEATENKTNEEIREWIADLRGGLINGIFDKRKLNSEEASYWKKLNNVFDEVVEASDMNTAFLESRVQNLLNSLEKELEERNTAGKEYIEKEITKKEVRTGESTIEMSTDEFEDYLKRLRSGDHEERVRELEEEFERWEEEGHDKETAIKKAIASVHQKEANRKIKEEIKPQIKEILDIEASFTLDDLDDYIEQEKENLSEEDIKSLEELKKKFDQQNHIKGYMLSLHQESEVLDMREREEKEVTEKKVEVTKKYQDMVGNLEDVSEKTIESGNEQVDRIIEEAGGARKVVATALGGAAGYLFGGYVARSAAETAMGPEKAAPGTESGGPVTGEDVYEGGASYPEAGPASATGEGPVEMAGGTEAGPEKTIDLPPTHIEGEVPTEFDIGYPGEDTIWDNVEAIAEKNDVKLSDTEIKRASVDIIEQNADQVGVDVEEWPEVDYGDVLDVSMSEDQLKTMFENYDGGVGREGGLNDILENAQEGGEAALAEEGASTVGATSTEGPASIPSEVSDMEATSEEAFADTTEPASSGGATSTENPASVSGEASSTEQTAEGSVAGGETGEDTTADQEPTDGEETTVEGGEGASTESSAEAESSAGEEATAEAEEGTPEEGAETEAARETVEATSETGEIIGEIELEDGEAVRAEKYGVDGWGAVKLEEGELMVDNLVPLTRDNALDVFSPEEGLGPNEILKKRVGAEMKFYNEAYETLEAAGQVDSELGQRITKQVESLADRLPESTDFSEDINENFDIS